jgi:hypothetical protein
VSRFESGAKDIQLSTVMRILAVLGMTDKRTLVFAATKKFRYDTERGVVVFSGYDADKLVKCAISTEALMDHFGKTHPDPLQAFKAYRVRIEHEARQKYLADNTEADGSVLLKTADIGL